MAAIKFPDSSEFDFGEKSKVKKQTGLNPDTGAPLVVFYFSNGQMRKFECPENLITKAAAHGLSQKIGDAFAGVDSVDDCVLAFDEMTERLGKGEWNAEREVASGAGGASVLARAIAELTGKDIESVRAKLKTLSPKAKTQMRSNPQLRPIIERMESEKTRKGDPVDTEALLSEF